MSSGGRAYVCLLCCLYLGCLSWRGELTICLMSAVVMMLVDLFGSILCHFRFCIFLVVGDFLYEEGLELFPCFIGLLNTPVFVMLS